MIRGYLRSGTNGRGQLGAYFWDRILLGSSLLGSATFRLVTIGLVTIGLMRRLGSATYGPQRHLGIIFLEYSFKRIERLSSWQHRLASVSLPLRRLIIFIDGAANFIRKG